MSQNELKPCPFCGGKDLGVGACQSWAVKCHDCWSKVQGYDTKKDAIKAWNTRASTPTPEAKELLEQIRISQQIYSIDEYADYVAKLLKDCKAFIEATSPKQQGE